MAPGFVGFAAVHFEPWGKIYVFEKVETLVGLPDFVALVGLVDLVALTAADSITPCLADSVG